METKLMIEIFLGVCYILDTYYTYPQISNKFGKVNHFFQLSNFGNLTLWKLLAWCQRISNCIIVELGLFGAMQATSP